MSDTIVIIEETSTVTVSASGPQGPTGAAGADGTDGVGVPAGGTTGQALVKASNTDYDTTWGAGGGGGATKLTDLTDVTGTAGTGKAPVSDGAGAFPLTDIATQAELDALSTVYQPLDSDLTAIAALSTTAFGRTLLTLADAAALRTDAGLGTAATAATTDFDAAGAAAAAQAAAESASQPLDSDLTAIAALAPTNDDIIQRKAGAWTNRTMAQLMADLAALGTTFQPLDSDLTAVAALTTTSFGRSLLTQADAAALRTTAGLVIGTDVQAYDAELAALAGLVSAADSLPYFTGSGTAALTTLSSFIRTLLDDADAATARTTLGLGSLATASSVTESTISLSDVTTDDVSITKHGFAPKAPNDATKYLDGTGAWSVPAGGGGASDVGDFNYAFMAGMGA